ncbi:DUF6973 domain-containing protein [Spirosoma sp. KNUC1025]|uniref:DUF6973 domain-containing protein n=1 Tax=Spirosoma sp. KNUC1025 TaxID=2894082 RepID=UPI003870290E|nr:hypothetical protein LN737_13390 [Spirosoma sp. KNUC1025]
MRILIPNGVPKEVFYPAIVKVNDPKARVAASKLTLEELVKIAKPIVDKYPDLSQNPLKQNHLNRILHDFPDFKEEKAVREKSDIVLQYYNGLIKHELKPLIEQALKSKGSGKVAQSSFGNINTLEWQHLNNNPVMISRYYYASNKAVSETAYRFGNANEGVQSNAFQHAIWNCLTIREAMYAGFTKNNAILFTRNICSDHECDANGNRQYTEHTAMDLHNNLSARSYMGNVSSGSVWPFSINVPSESDLFDAWYHAATTRNYHICNAVSYITSMYSWEFLYGGARGNMGDKLYYIWPVPSGC